ncbi:MAG: TetR/AcrR family transcriptional regulator [Bacteroidota bacterium]
MPRTKQFDENEVLQKAMELFWEKGFHATSIQDLVSHLGINRASLYDTFGGKEALFDQAFSLYRMTNAESIEQLLAKSVSIKEGFRKLFDLAIQETVSDKARKGCFVVNTTTELVPGDETLYRTLLANKNRFEHIFAVYLQKGIDSGELKSSLNANDLASFMYTFYSGLRVVTKLENNAESLRMIVETGLRALD